MTGLYIHVPFCIRKCPYCDFYSKPYSAELAELYVNAVCRNVAALKGLDIAADTVYFGGGTPSLLTARQVYDILDSVQKNVHLHSPEITLEGNPSSLNYEKLSGYRAAGVDRLSVGVQSADNSQLRFLGRLHDADKAYAAVYAAQRAGFENISCDLMLGLAGQDIASLTASIERLTDLPITHLSAYMLKIEQGTAFDCEAVRGQVADDDLMSELYLTMCAQLADKSFEHYEISNFAKQGFRSRHNMKYWQLEKYIGIGPSAHSDFHEKRTACPADIQQFVTADVQKNVLIEEDIDRFEEYLMLALRLSDGADFNELARRGGRDTAESIFNEAHELEKHGLVKFHGGGFSLTDEGFLLSNSIIVHLLDCRKCTK